MKVFLIACLWLGRSLNSRCILLSILVKRGVTSASVLLLVLNWIHNIFKPFVCFRIATSISYFLPRDHIIRLTSVRSSLSFEIKPFFFIICSFARVLIPSSLEEPKTRMVVHRQSCALPRWLMLSAGLNSRWDLLQVVIDKIFAIPVGAFDWVDVV